MPPMLATQLFIFTCYNFLHKSPLFGFALGLRLDTSLFCFRIHIYV
jgi:hypothetical protein